MINILHSLRKVISVVFEWSFLRGVQSYRIVKSTYIWLFILPVIAKLFSKIESTLRINLYGKEILLDLDLPFAWILLFYSALFFTIGNLIFIFFCPAIIKENRSLADFKATMKTQTHLTNYMTEAQRTDWEFSKTTFAEGLHRMARSGNASDPAVTARVRSDRFDEEFWSIYKQQNVCHQPVRVAVLIIYVVAACCFLSVLCQNIYYVFTQY